MMPIVWAHIALLPWSHIGGVCEESRMPARGRHAHGRTHTNTYAYCKRLHEPRVRAPRVQASGN